MKDQGDHSEPDAQKAVSRRNRNTKAEKAGLGEHSAWFSRALLLKQSSLNVQRDQDLAQALSPGGAQAEPGSSSGQRRHASLAGGLLLLLLGLGALLLVPAVLRPVEPSSLTNLCPAAAGYLGSLATRQALRAESAWSPAGQPGLTPGAVQQESGAVSGEADAVQAAAPGIVNDPLDELDLDCSTPSAAASDACQAAINVNTYGGSSDSIAEQEHLQDDEAVDVPTPSDADNQWGVGWQPGAAGGQPQRGAEEAPGACSAGDSAEAGAQQAQQAAADEASDLSALDLDCGSAYLTARAACAAAAASNSYEGSGLLGTQELGGEGGGELAAAAALGDDAAQGRLGPSPVEAVLWSLPPHVAEAAAQLAARAQASYQRGARKSGYDMAAEEWDPLRGGRAYPGVSPGGFQSAQHRGKQCTCRDHGGHGHPEHGHAAREHEHGHSGQAHAAHQHSDECGAHDADTGGDAQRSPRQQGSRGGQGAGPSLGGVAGMAGQDKLALQLRAGYTRAVRTPGFDIPAVPAAQQDPDALEAAMSMEYAQASRTPGFDIPAATPPVPDGDLAGAELEVGYSQASRTSGFDVPAVQKPQPDADELEAQMEVGYAQAARTPGFDVPVVTAAQPAQMQNPDADQLDAEMELGYEQAVRTPGFDVPARTTPKPAPSAARAYHKAGRNHPQGNDLQQQGLEQMRPDDPARVYYNNPANAPASRGRAPLQDPLAEQGGAITWMQAAAAAALMLCSAALLTGAWRLLRRQAGRSGEVTILAVSTGTTWADPVQVADEQTYSAAPTAASAAQPDPSSDVAPGGGYDSPRGRSGADCNSPRLQLRRLQLDTAALAGGAARAPDVLPPSVDSPKRAATPLGGGAKGGKGE